MTIFPLDDADMKGDLYEYLLSKLTTAGINGQFRTPRHIIKLMVEMVDPKPGDRIGDPACGTAGFLVRSMEYIMRKSTSDEGSTTGLHPLQGPGGGTACTSRRGCFHGFDFDRTMLRYREP